MRRLVSVSSRLRTVCERRDLTRSIEGIRLSTLPKISQDAIEIMGLLQMEKVQFDSFCALRVVLDNWIGYSCKMSEFYRV